MYIDLLIKIAPLITIVIGVITIIGTYYNKELSKNIALEERYFNEVLVQYMAKYNEHNNINSVKFIKSRYGYSDYFIPSYIFSLVMKNDAKVLHKVLVSDYERGFASELNCFKNTLKKISDNLRVIFAIIGFFVLYYVVYEYLYIINNEVQISISKNKLLGLLFFVIIMLCILVIVVGSFMWGFKKIIIKSLEEENRYTTKEKYIMLQVKNRVKDYDDSIGRMKELKIGLLPNNIH